MDIQYTNNAITPEQLAALDTTINNLRTETSTLQATAKTLRGTLGTLNATLSTADLVSSMTGLKEEKAEIVRRLETLKAGKAKKVTKKEMDAVDDEMKKWTGVARRREKIVNDMWRLIEDALPDRERREEVRESLGLDD